MSARTTARIGVTLYSGEACSECFTAYDMCTERVLRTGQACCRACRSRGTHDERRETAVDEPKPIERIRVHGWPYRPTMPEKR